MQLNAIEIIQNNVKFYLCTMTAKELADIEKVKVDYYSASKDEGYQRKPTLARAKDFARYIKKCSWHMS